MLDRQKVESILRRRFPAAARDIVADTTNAIMGLADGWEEVLHDDEFGYHYAERCGDTRDQVHHVLEAGEFRMFHRRHPNSAVNAPH
jgi:hypothetical protein